MVFIFANIILLAVVFTGIGLLWPWSVFKQDHRFESLLLCFWIGWGLTIGFLQIWHLAFPVGLPALVILLGVSAFGWLHRRELMIQTFCAWDRKKFYWLAGLSLIPALMVANHVLFTPPISDYALYHLQSVKWISTYRILPGLGNLYNPLALNCSSFLYTAAIDSGWLEGRAYYVSTTLLAFVLILQCANGFYNLLTRGKVKNADLFYALMIPVVLLNVSTSSLVAYSPDMIVFIMHIVLAGEVLRLFDDQDQDRFYNRAAQIIFLTATAITVKLSLGVFGLLCLLPVLILALLRYQLWPWRRLRLWAVWLGLASFLVIPWIVRNILISGYPLFPSSVLPMPVPWKMSINIVIDAALVIRKWAQTNNAAFHYTGDWFWFKQWWNVFPFFARQAFVFTLGLFFLNQLFFVILRKQAKWDQGAALISAISVPSIVFWFLMAPSYRHSGALLWIFLAAEILVTFRLLITAGWVTRPHLVAISLVLVMALWQSPNQFSNNLSMKLFLIPKTEQALAEKALPLSSYRQQVTDSGLVVIIPRDGTEECWNAPLPCTTKLNFSRRLHTLIPGDLQSGLSRER